MNVLEVTNVDAGYRLVSVLHKVSLLVKEKQVAVLLGANGAGKTTTLRAISGLVQAKGSIKLDNQELVGLSPDKIARLGVAHAAEGRGTFTDLTVQENLLVAAYRRNDRKQITRDLEEVYDLFPRLYERMVQKAGSMSGGEQQMLAIGRTLMMKPRLILLDEPSLGLAPVIIDILFDALQRINKEKEVSMLIVEQNANLALDIADYAYVLETGRIVLSGTAASVASHEKVRSAYLGA